MISMVFAPETMMRWHICCGHSGPQHRARSYSSSGPVLHKTKTNKAAYSFGLKMDLEGPSISLISHMGASTHGPLCTTWHSSPKTIDDC